VASEGHADGQPAAAQHGIWGTTTSPSGGDRWGLQIAARTYWEYEPLGLREGGGLLLYETWYLSCGLFSVPAPPCHVPQFVQRM
jgi:hypothetical protein